MITNKLKGGAALKAKDDHAPKSPWGRPELTDTYRIGPHVFRLWEYDEEPDYGVVCQAYLVTHESDGVVSRAFQNKRWMSERVALEAILVWLSNRFKGKEDK